MNRLSKLPMVLIACAVGLDNLLYVFSWLGTGMFSRISFVFVNLICLYMVIFYYVLWKWAVKDCDAAFELLYKHAKEKNNASKSS